MLSSGFKGGKEGGTEDVRKQIVDVTRRYKNIESDRKAYAEETQAQIKKQKNLIERLQKENVQLKKEAININQQVQQSGNKTVQQTKMEGEVSTLQELIDTEKLKCGQMDNHIRTLQKEILEQKKRMKGMSSHQRHDQLQKQISILENRLDKANQKFNEAIAHNKNLRGDIDSLRRERVIFDNIYRKLEMELHKKRKKMADIIEIANTAYEERDQAQEQLASLIQTADRNLHNFQKDIKNANAISQKNKDLDNYLKMKGNEKFDLERMELEAKAEDQLNNTRQQQSRTNWMAAKEKATNIMSAERVQTYQEHFAKIQAATGIADIDKLVSNFIQAEERNFTLFKYVNELSNNIEALESQIAAMKTELAQHTSGGHDEDDLKKQKVLKELEEQLSKAEAKAEQYESEYQAALKQVNSIKAAIESIYKTLECDEQAHQQLIGEEGVTVGSQGVTETNIMTYLGIIEERVNELLEVYTRIQATKAGSGNPLEQEGVHLRMVHMNRDLDFGSAAAGPSAPSLKDIKEDRKDIRIDAPSIQDESDEAEDEGDDRPLNPEELKNRAESQYKTGNTLLKKKPKQKMRR